MFKILVTLFFVTAASMSFAEDMVKILVGGPASVILMKSKQADLDKAAGVKVDPQITAVDTGMLALGKGLVDGVISGGNAEDALAIGEKAGLPKQNLEDYQWTKINTVFIYAGVNPTNPVPSLSKEQLNGILSGKINNWESVGGINLPIEVLLPQNQLVSVKVLKSTYLMDPSAFVGKFLPDRNGVISAIKAKPGTIGFFTSKDSLDSFTPKYLDTTASYPTVLIMKKKSRDPAQKLFDYLKANPLAK